MLMDFNGFYISQGT